MHEHKTLAPSVLNTITESKAMSPALSRWQNKSLSMSVDDHAIAHWSVKNPVHWKQEVFRLKKPDESDDLSDVLSLIDALSTESEAALKSTGFWNSYMLM